jgi:hypothetical protein
VAKPAARDLVIRPRPAGFAKPASMRGMISPVRYFSSQKPCSLTPSHSSAATFSIAGPTAAIITGGGGASIGSGAKFGVIKVKR